MITINIPATSLAGYNNSGDINFFYGTGIMEIYYFQIQNSSIPINELEFLIERNDQTDMLHLYHGDLLLRTIDLSRNILFAFFESITSYSVDKETMSKITNAVNYYLSIDYML